MRSLIELLIDGALLGDVVETLTGQDVTIERSPPNYSKIPGGIAIRCTHNTHAFLGDILLGTAEVVWEGEITSYELLIKVRMKKYLRQHHACPVVESYNPKEGLLKRNFFLESPSGILLIREKLLTHNIATAVKINQFSDEAYSIHQSLTDWNDNEKLMSRIKDRGDFDEGGANSTRI